MRHFIISLIFIFGSLAVNANPISPEEAQSIAADFFNTSTMSGNITRKALHATVPNHITGNFQPYYIFNADDNNGFVIISGDSRAKKILGYSEKGSFSTKNMPPQLMWLLNEYQKIMDSIPNKAPTPKQNISRNSDQAPLLSTQWGQGSPYNEKCPIVYGTHAVTGCVATAMAQIINYENKSNHVAEIPDYWCTVYMPALPEYDFDFGNLDNDGVATLMLYCGQSVRMDYGPQESGAAVQDVPDALRNYFGWDQNVRTMERSNYNDEHWNRMVEEEIAAGHPLLYSAVSETSGWHAFVVDGIADDLFHVNWGWDGYLDGYYSFQPLMDDHKSEFINMQWMVASRDDDPSADIITYGTTINGINYQLNDNLTASVLPLKNGEKYRGDLVIPSHVEYNGNTYTVNYFGPNAFVKCEHLESIYIPATIEGQEWSIFDGCINLHKVDVEDMAAFIRIEVGGWWTGSPLWEDADLYLKGELVKDLVIPEGIKEIGYCKFAHCTSIESVTMPTTMKRPGQYSFANCPNLKHVDMLKSSIETLGSMAFVNDVSIESIILPPTLKTMEHCAIGQENGPGCKSLRKIVSLANTPPWSVEDNTFSDLHYSDAVVYVPDESVDEYRQSKEWCKFMDIRPISEERPLLETATLTDEGIQYEIYITEGYAKITGISDYGFYNGVIPNSVKYNDREYPVEIIGYRSLCDTYIIQLDASIKKIGIEAFWYASFENTFKLPETVDIIPDRAFRCAKIPYLILPENLSYIGHEAFGGDDWYRVYAIESLNPEVPLISDDTFDSLIYDEVPLMVPFGCKKKYLSSPGWRNFKNISNIGDDQEQIFDNDLTLTASIPNNIAVKDRMPINIAGTIMNSGLKNTSGFILSWYIDGRYLGEKLYNIELSPYEIFTFDEKITANIDYSGLHELKLIISIDGTEDQDISDNEVTLTFESFDKGFYRISLIEQFTSEACSITPIVSSKIPDGILKSGYADFVAYVTHHCGFLDDFLTINHDYEWFYNDYGTYTPAMMINRSDIYDTDFTPVSGIPDDIDRKIINEAGLCDALVSVYCDIEDGKIRVKTLLEKDDDFDLNAGYDHVTVFLVEDNIPAEAQVDPWSDGYVEDYIHRNTVRKVLSSVWGDKIEWTDDICALKYETDIEDTWNTDNLKAVAFIHRYDPTSPINCQVYTANSSVLPQYGREVDDSLFKDPTPPIILTTSIDIKQNVELKVGEGLKLIATVLPENATDKSLTWSSSDESVAVVDNEGYVTAINIGEADIIVKAADGSDVIAVCHVMVYPIIVEAIYLTPENWSGKVGESFKIEATVLPENATDKSLTWSSSDESVAVVDNEGYVIIINDGSCMIIASALDDSNVSAECLITSVAGINNICIDDNGKWNIYDVNGLLLKKNCDKEDLKILCPGIYVFSNDSETIKIIIR